VTTAVVPAQTSHIAMITAVDRMAPDRS
jgi:hypothetical protein